MKKNKALYAGTFDPFTNGHLDIVKRALEVFSDVTILVAVSPNKKPLLSTEQRLESIKKIFDNNPKVNVDSWDGLVVEYAKQQQIKSIVRGLRPTGDFEIEFQMASMNKRLMPECETFFLVTSENFYYVSSSLVKEVFTHGGDVSPFVPAIVFEELKKISKG